MSTKPIIAILTAQTEDKGIPIEKVSMGYTRCVHEAGGIPIILPNLEEALDHYLPLMDGLLIIGGSSDVHPSLYGETVDKAEKLNLKKDQFELKLIEGALQKKISIMGICRGMQMLNVFFGGSLTQHIDDHFHRDRFDQNIHHVEIQNSRLVDPGIYHVNSMHHQVVNQPGAELLVTGRSHDGHIEMIEHRTLPVFGTQWHPECLPEEELTKQLFAQLIHAS